MKTVALVVLMLLSGTPALRAQFRGQEPRPPSVAEKVQGESSSLLFGFLNTDNFHISQSISTSYMSSSWGGLGVTTYTNSILYKISDPLTFSADVSYLFSPYGSASEVMRSDANKIFLQRAELNYRPTRDFSIVIEYNQVPAGLYGFSAINPYGWYGMQSTLPRKRSLSDF
jgi:hypothetical protein